MQATPVGGGPPASRQQAAELAADEWDAQWGAGKQHPPCQWPDDMGAIPPMMTVAAFKDACRSFPNGTGLGWDGIHPKALLRLPVSCLSALVRILFISEAHGRWPMAIELVIIALIPSPTVGGGPLGSSRGCRGCGRGLGGRLRGNGRRPTRVDIFSRVLARGPTSLRGSKR